MRLARRLPAVFVTVICCWCWCGAGSAFATAGRFVSAVASADEPADQRQPPRLVLVDDGAELDAALAARTPPRDLAVQVAAVNMPDADPAKGRLLIIVDIAGARSPGRSPDGAAGTPPANRLASVAFVIENERSQAVARGLRRRELPWTPNMTLGFSETVVLPPGTYLLKVAAMRNTKVGAAQAMVVVRVQSAGAFRFGDVVVGESVGDDVGSSRAFDRMIRGDRLVASLAVAEAGTVSAEGLTVTVDVAKDAAGPAIMSAPAGVLTAQESVRLAQAVLDVRALPPGEYVARATVSVAGKEVGRTTAPFTRERAAGAPAPASSPGTPAAPRSRSAPAPPVPGAGFRAEDVLEAPVLRPFLDELASRAPDRAKPAIDQAKAGRFTEAAQAAASADPNGAAKPFLQGLSLLSQKQLQAASDAFRETLRAAPDFFVGAFYLGACYAAGGRDPQAVNAWQTSLVGLEQFPVVFRLLAEAMVRMGQPDRALETLDEAIAKWPGDADMRLRAARAALDAKRYDRVFTLVDEAGTGRSSPDLLLAGIQAVYEQASLQAGAPGGEAMGRARRYRDAYAAAGGTRQALVAEWVAVLERKK